MTPVEPAPEPETTPEGTGGAGLPRVSQHRRVAALTGIVAGVVATATVVAGLALRDEPAPQPTAAPTVEATPTPAPVPTLAAVPAPPGPDELAALPLAFYDAVVPQLLDDTTVTPENRWQTAAPRAPLVALYASPDADAAPVATLGSTVPTLLTPTVTAVWGSSPGVDGGMLLVSTPARNRTPGDGGVATAPAATFGWVRAADVTVTDVDRAVVVDTVTGLVSVTGRDGSVGASEVGRLGTPDDPTPTATETYMAANYVDQGIAYTQGNPIALTGAHSPLLASYGGNSALTALHFYPDPTGSSHGCVRVSAAMTAALAALPVGTPVTFT